MDKCCCISALSTCQKGVNVLIGVIVFLAVISISLIIAKKLRVGKHAKDFSNSFKNTRDDDRNNKHGLDDLQNF